MRYRKYTIEELKEEALKYTSRQSFKKGSYSQYRAAHNYGEIAEVTSHMCHTHPRVCSNCGCTKGLEEFTKNSSCVEGRTQCCKDCVNSSQNLKASMNPDYKEMRRNSARRGKERTRARMLEYHGGTLSCADCKFTSEIYSVFDYHHLDPLTKEHTVSSILDWKWETIKTEMDKCELLCANCHRIRHYKEHLNGKKSQENKENSK